MNVLAFQDHVFNGDRVELAVWTVTNQDFGPVGKELRGAAFIRFDVSDLRTNDGVITLTKRGEREGIGGSAVEDEKDFTFGFKDFANEVGCARGKNVVPIPGRMAAV